MVKDPLQLSILNLKSEDRCNNGHVSFNKKIKYKVVGICCQNIYEISIFCSDNLILIFHWTITV